MLFQPRPQPVPQPSPLCLSERAALYRPRRAQRDRLNKVPPRPEALLPRSTGNRPARDRMIERHRAGPPGEAAYRPAPRHPESAEQQVGQSVQASEAKQVVALDWDDCLRDEKGLNYQLMHNALAVAAHEHGAKYPELALLAALGRAVPQAAARPQASATQGGAELPAQPPQAELRDRLRDALQRGDEAALQGALAAAAPHAHAELARRLMTSLHSSDCEALRQALGEAVAYAHPDTAKAERVDRKPSPKQLQDSLAHLAVPPEVPIVSYGDRASDVKQLAGVDNQRRRLEGVIVNAQHAALGEHIAVDGIPTRVQGHFAAS